MKIKDGFVLEEVGGAYLAVAVGEMAGSFNGMVRLNGTGAFIWKLLSERDLSRDEIVAEMLSAYVDAKEEEVTAAVTAFEAKLREAGIIED